MRLLHSLSLASFLSLACLYAAPIFAAKPMFGRFVGSSSDGDVAFASAYSDTLNQTILTASLFTPIRFTTDRLHTPRDITHPYSKDDSIFRVKKDGTYEIGWIVTFSRSFTMADDTVTFELINAKTGLAFHPVPLQTLSVSTTNCVSGQVILYFDKDTAIQLRASSSQASNTNPLQIIDPVLFINRIGD